MADLTITLNGTQIPVYLGESAELARQYANAAAASAATALAAAGPNYANTAAGLAATDEGETFAVDNGDGTLTIYLHEAGPVATALRTLIIDPAAAGASALLGFTSAGTGAEATTIEERLRRVVRAFDFYTEAQKAACLAGTNTDVSAALQEAVDYAKTLDAPHLIVDHGRHYLGTTNVDFDLPDSSMITFEGIIASAAASNAAITIGTLTGNTFYMSITGIKVVRTSNDTAGTSIGVRLLNLASCHLQILNVSGFRQGVLAEGVGFGFVYNEIRLGYIHDNRTNLQLSASGGAGGYNNECRWHGGSFGHSSAYPAVSTTNIIIDHNATNSLNNHSFYSPSLEDNADPAGSVVAATINGQFNNFFMPRLENSAVQATYQIVFTANAIACSIIGRGFAGEQGNITDSGTTTSWDVIDGTRLSRSTPADAAKAVLKLQSSATSSARLLQLLASGGTESGYFDGSANGRLNRVYFNEGIRWSTSSGTFTDRGLFVGSGSPEGAVTASAGSLFAQSNGGYATSLHVKGNGTGNTGWAAVPTYIEGSATFDPSNLADGAGETTTVTVTGAALGDFAAASFSLDLQGITVTAYVSATNTVSVRFQNESGGAIDLASGTLRARVFKV